LGNPRAIEAVPQLAAGARTLLLEAGPLHPVLEKLPFPAVVCDAGGAVTYANPRALELFGRAPTLADARWMEVALREQRDVVGQEIAVERHDGERIHALAYASPIRGDAGEVSGAILVLVDISDRVRAHETRARLAAIIESSDDAIIGKLLDGTITSWNAGAQRIFGYSADEMIGRSVRVIIPPERAAEEDEILARLRAGERIGHFETVRLAKGGLPVDVSLAISPIRDAHGQVIGASKVARDITIEKRAHAVLRESDRVKDEFLAILAHELRNRLAPIGNAVEILMNSGQLVPESKPAVELIERQTRQMVLLVNDLLDVSRISRNDLPLRRKRTKLENVLREAVEVSRPLIDEREQTLKVSLPERPIYLSVDRVRLAQVISNLLNNASKYTPRGGHIALGAKRDSDEAVITVRDDGAGIDPAILSRLFEMFVHVDTPTEGAPRGLGVGLTLAKRIVELHDGRIEAHSAGLGAGSEFVVRMPVAKPPARRRRTRVAAPPVQAAARRILLVDDDRDLAESLAMALTSLGNDVRTAHDGPEALALAREFRPDAIALDVSLPTMSGFDVVRQLRAEEWGRAIPVVALTGWSQDETRDRAREAGFDHYLVKPVEAATLTKVFDGLRAPVAG
jgi:PAS domain S-box-containing protein